MYKVLKHTLVIFIIFIQSQLVYSQSCFPKSDLKISIVQYPSNKSFTAGTAIVRTEAVLNKLVTRFKNYWNPILARKHGKKLTFKINWKDKSVDASTTRDDDNYPVISISGGLARHPELSSNGLLIILCHELGHHFGGAPKKFRGRSQKRSWSSAEGQADYFATNKCLKKMLIDGELYPINQNLQKSFCSPSIIFPDCDPIKMASISVGNVFASLKPYWERPNPNMRSPLKVSRIEYKHPSPQCRYDTYMAGSLCHVGIENDFDDNDYRVGSCLFIDEPLRARPQCWFNSDKQ